MHRFSAFILLLALTACSVVAALTASATNIYTGLTFAEHMYVRLSSACRAFVDLSATTIDEQNESLKTIRIIQIDGKIVKTFPIDEAYAALRKNSTFDITKQTKVIIHGFKDSAYSAIPQELAQAYSDKRMFNVLLVDAEELFSQRYITCVRNARLVGKRLANLLANLENYGANADDFHILGISLGAHVAGWTGKYFRQYKGRRLGHITGLDPAGPCFSYAYSEQRLDRTDANYVDVLHSNRLVQGVIEPLGHADFYLNGGGPTQPGCIMPSCSHLRAAEVYAESIRFPKSFIGVRCLSWKHFVAHVCEKDLAVMGYGSPTSTRGLYYLRTAASSPFGLGIEGTKTAQVSKMDKWLRTFNFTDI